MLRLYEIAIHPMKNVRQGTHNMGKFTGKTVTLAHGAGGKAMHDLIEQIFVATFDSPELSQMEDQARFSLADLNLLGDRLALTTDSYVVDPLFFPGGDIGKLAVTGTINDLAVGGATPLYLTCGMILEEGFSFDDLLIIVQSMKATADEAGVRIVTGDTKVVPRGAADKLFINTAGVGVIPETSHILANRAEVGDVVIINGYIGDHGAAIVDARGELALEMSTVTDCQPLNGLITDMLKVCPDIHCMRDATRGGLATVLNEFAQGSDVAIQLDQTQIPVREEVKGVCEILGLDPLYLANEGKLVAIVAKENADALLTAMQAHPAGKDSHIIGVVEKSPKGKVILATGFGGNRIIDMLIGEQLPRIC